VQRCKICMPHGPALRSVLLCNGCCLMCAVQSVQVSLLRGHLSGKLWHAVQLHHVGWHSACTVCQTSNSSTAHAQTRRKHQWQHQAATYLLLWFVGAGTGRRRQQSTCRDREGGRRSRWPHERAGQRFEPCCQISMPHDSAGQSLHEGCACGAPLRMGAVVGPRRLPLATRDHAPLTCCCSCWAHARAEGAGRTARVTHACRNAG
jgi:hypothetical protein